MPLTPDAWEVDDDLADLVHEAAARAATELPDGDGGPVLVLGQRERRADEAPGDDELDPGVVLDTAVHPHVEAARAAARAGLVPGGWWRAALAWREGGSLRVLAQTADVDEVAGRFAAPLGTGGTPDLDELDIVGIAEPLRPLTWLGRTFALLDGAGQTVADLLVDEQAPAALHVEVQPHEGLDALLAPSGLVEPPTQPHAVRAPDDAALDGARVALNGRRGRLWFPGYLGQTEPLG
ncbi:MAG TPA: hypothetical protein VN238_23300 [Solirubrobacteraceae bacterium]|nr:hypothetical protein [Solirubrobacteraceae bacterium]